ncbi:MAG TPA: DNA polymerase [Flavobacteriales bacterium]|nr:DNA polymerase [Flavobacteriales bacterium]
MPKVALVETKPSRTDYIQHFGGEFSFDQFQLCSNPAIKKVLKKDCDIDIDTSLYDWIILVGSESLKYFTKINSVTEYSGKKVEDKFLPVINPAMLAFKPEAKKTWETSKDNIIKYINGEIKDVIIDDSIAFGITDSKEAEEFIDKALAYEDDFIALDSETTSLYPRNGYMLGLSLCYDGQTAAYIDTNCINEAIESKLQELFNKKTVIFHNAKFDLAWFEYHFGFKFPNIEDTMLLSYLINENPGHHGLKALALKYTPYGDYEKPMHDWIDQYRKENRILKADFNYGEIPFDIMKVYAAMDALVTFKLFEKFEKIKENEKLAWVYKNLLLPGTKFLLTTQENGVPFDKERLIIAQDLMQQNIDEAIKALYSEGRISEFEKLNGKPFNPNSTVQLRSLLFDFIGLTPTGKKTGTGANSTDAEVLGILAEKSEIPQHILAIRQKSKIKNTYLDKIIPQLDKDMRLRTSFNLHSTTSGRLSSSGKLNMQQIPRDNPIVKGCIRASAGSQIVAMDLTTAEVYVAAKLANDEALMNVFREGGNFHSTIAKTVFKLPCKAEEVAELYPYKRQAAKAVTFGIMYGAGPHKISQQVTKDSGKYFSVQEASEVIHSYFKQFHKLKSWIEKSQKFIEANGFVYSFFGRKRRLPNVKSEDKAIRSHTVRSGLNFLVQSTASDINLLGAIEMDAHIKANNMEAKIFALVHDSILAEVPDGEIKQYCEVLQYFIQRDRGLSISGAPIGCDFDIGDDYSMGKFEDQYGDYMNDSYIQNPG